MEDRCTLSSAKKRTCRSGGEWERVGEGRRRRECRGGGGGGGGGDGGGFRKQSPCHVAGFRWRWENRFLVSNGGGWSKSSDLFAGAFLAIIFCLLPTMGEGAWKQLKPPPPTPGVRFGHASVLLPNRQLFVFGGKHPVTNNLLGDTWLFSFWYNKWVLIEHPYGSSPAPRVYAAAVSVGENVLLYGGDCYSPRKGNELLWSRPCRDTTWLYKLAERQWINLPMRGILVKPRSHVAAVSNGMTFYIHGGRRDGGWIDEESRKTFLPTMAKGDVIWSVDLAENTSFVAFKSDPHTGPPEDKLLRFGHAAALVESKIWMSGGMYKGAPRKDVVSFDITTSTWDRYTALTGPGRAFHNMVAFNSRYLVSFGGYVLQGTERGVDKNGASDAMRVFDLYKFKWGRIYPRSNDVPAKRMSHAGGMLDDRKLVVSGGWTGVEGIDDMWTFDVTGVLMSRGTAIANVMRPMGTPVVVDRISLVVFGNEEDYVVRSAFANFTDVPRGNFTVMAVDSGTVVGYANGNIRRAGRTVAVWIPAAEKKSYLFEMTMEDGYTPMPGVTMTIDVNEVDLGDRPAATRSWKPYTVGTANAEGICATKMYPSFLPGLGLEFHTRYRLQFWHGTRKPLLLLFVKDDFIVPPRPTAAEQRRRRAGPTVVKIMSKVRFLQRTPLKHGANHYTLQSAAQYYYLNFSSMDGSLCRKDAMAFIMNMNIRGARMSPCWTDLDIGEKEADDDGAAAGGRRWRGNGTSTTAAAERRRRHDGMATTSLAPGRGREGGGFRFESWELRSPSIADNRWPRNPGSSASTAPSAPLLALPAPATTSNLPPPPPLPPLPASNNTTSTSAPVMSSGTATSNGQYGKGSGWYNTNQRVAALEETVSLLKNWYGAEMAKILAKWAEEARLLKEREDEERRLKEKQDREKFQKELSDTWNAKFESVCGALRANKGSNASEVEIEKLKKQIEDLRVNQRHGLTNPGASTSAPTTGNDALLARILQEHDDMKDTVRGCCRLRQSREEALQEAETWKKEALKSGNKRSRIATSPSSSLKMPPAATPAKGLQEIHNLEVEALKALRLKELNWRWEAEQENERLKQQQREMEREHARLKEELSKRGQDKRTPLSSFRERLDEADGPADGLGARTVRKKKSASGSDEARDNDRDAFMREERKEFRNLKKDGVMEICLREDVKYTILTETVTEIIAKRAERAFGKRAVVQEISDDLAEGGQDNICMWEVLHGISRLVGVSTSIVHVMQPWLIREGGTSGCIVGSGGVEQAAREDLLWDLETVREQAEQEYSKEPENFQKRTQEIIELKENESKTENGQKAANPQCENKRTLDNSPIREKGQADSKRRRANTAEGTEGGVASPQNSVTEKPAKDSDFAMDEEDSDDSKSSSGSAPISDSSMAPYAEKKRVREQGQMDAKENNKDSNDPFQDLRPKKWKAAKVQKKQDPNHGQTETAKKTARSDLELELAVIEAQAEKLKKLNAAYQPEFTSLQHIAEGKAPHVLQQARSARLTMMGLQPLLAARYVEETGEWQVATEVSFAIPLFEEGQNLVSVIREKITDTYPLGVYQTEDSTKFSGGQEMGGLHEDQRVTLTDPADPRQSSFTPLIAKMPEKTRLKRGMMWRSWDTVTAIPYSVLSGLGIPAELPAASLADILRADVTRSVRASDKLQTIHSRQWRSAKATMTYDTLSREVVAFEAQSMPVSTFCHKDLDKGKKWKGSTISGQQFAPARLARVELKSKHEPLTLFASTKFEHPNPANYEWKSSTEENGGQTSLRWSFGRNKELGLIRLPPCMFIGVVGSSSESIPFVLQTAVTRGTGAADDFYDGSDEELSKSAKLGIGLGVGMLLLMLVIVLAILLKLMHDRKKAKANLDEKSRAFMKQGIEIGSEDALKTKLELWRHREVIR
ncbi:hypothetical protein CBR_g21123 [Chara braunii]|uniref:Uncharacterized protein n=1 Tax=Chara braunii TaxID=69332 RepID=A0A388L0S4_CHABU|nr:hypothetical protein CBR_g21123 [Chara braunii]|eukprot:GBG75881.1 hypothetical protein CBR_g21123 [Chara braunii]